MVVKQKFYWHRKEMTIHYHCCLLRVSSTKCTLADYTANNMGPILGAV